MKHGLFLGALGASLLVAAHAVQAVTLTSVTLNGNDNNGVLIEPTLLGIDAGLRNFSPITFNFTRTPNSAAMYDFNSVLENLSGFNWGAVSYQLTGGAYFSPVPGSTTGYGSVTPSFGTISSVLLQPPVDPTSVRVGFAGLVGEPNQFVLGNPFGLVGPLDWQLSLARVAVGDSFSVVINATPIPVPGGLVLMLSGLVAAGTLLRRKRAV